MFVFSDDGSILGGFDFVVAIAFGVVILSEPLEELHLVSELFLPLLLLVPLVFSLFGEVCVFLEAFVALFEELLPHKFLLFFLLLLAIDIFLAFALPTVGVVAVARPCERREDVLHLLHHYRGDGVVREFH